jgi:hypothetical protein
VLQLQALATQPFKLLGNLQQRQQQQQAQASLIVRHLIWCFPQPTNTMPGVLQHRTVADV